MEKQKMSVLTELEKLTSNSYVISISSDTTVHKDDYQNGEGDCVNSWENSKKVFKTTSDKISTELSIALKEYIENELNLDYDANDMESLFDEYTEDDHIWLSRFVDVDNDTPSKEQIESWKQGDEELFVQLICVYVEINGIAVNCEMLKKLIFSTENA